ncbi:MAG: arabinofuranan 3-O-arabinosyltransferase, partial [Solirubrobacteraceae bacterium]|nr:arabinofuranan 3-O-arabinosyltransferase [Solirubrobacteraceae bacterium]
MSRRRLIPLGLALLSYALAFGQRPGEVIADTKVQLYVDPARFLGHVVSAWSPTADLGHVWAGQYGGYLFPMAPWFTAGDALGLPVWVVHRLWLGTLLAFAAWGVVRLLDELWDRERGVAHAAAAVLFVVNPYVTVYANRTSVALLAYAALPWLLLFVHRGVRDPRAWRWPAAFALVLACTGGGVNVAVTGWVLLAPVLLVVYELGWGGADRRALVPYAGRLAACVAVASAWWVVPVIVHARYGTDFLPFTEQPGTIWGTTSISESLRLMGFWTSYIGVGFGGRLDPFAGHGHVLLFSPVVVTAGLLVPALALGGFAWTRRARYGPFFLLLALVGVVVMAAGWPEGTPLRRGLTFTYNHEHALQFLRTTYKAGPLVALGLAVLGGGALAAALARIRRQPRQVALAAAAAVLVGVAAWPLVTGQAVERQLAFKVPDAWRQVAGDLSRRGDGSRALLEPGQLFAFQRWGGTIDNILPALTDHPVATRYIVPFSDLRSTDLQWGVDDLIGQERAVPGQLRRMLDLMAVGDLVVASDTDRRRGGGQGPGEATQALAPLLTVPGSVYGKARKALPAPGRIGTPQRLPQIRRVELPTAGIVRVLPHGPATIVDGAAAGIAALASFGDLPADRPIRYAADMSAATLRSAAEAGATVAISDSNRRQAFVAARLLQNRGAVLPAGQDVSQDGTFLDPFGRGPDAQTVAVQRGIARISSPFSPQTSQFPEHRPFAAVDGDVRTSWLGDRFLAPQRRHLDLTFLAPRAVPYVDLLPYSDPRGITRNVIVNGRLIRLHPGWNRLRLGIARTQTLRIELFGTKRPTTGSAGGGGIRELRVPGLKVDELLRPPVLAENALRGAALSKTRLQYLFDRFTADLPGQRGPLAGDAQAGLARDARDPEPQLARTIDPPAPRRWTADAWVHVAPTASDAAIDRLAGATGGGTATSSSRFENRPVNRASSAFDGVAGTAWTGQWIPGRAAFLAWTTRRPATIKHLKLVAPDFVARFPKLVSLNGTQAPVGADGSVTFPAPVRGTAFRLDIVRAAFPGGTPGRLRQRRAVAIAEVLGAHLRLAVPRAGALPKACGNAAVTAGGQPLAFRVTGDIAALDAGGPLLAHGCAALDLPAKRFDVRGVSRTFVIDHLRLDSPAPGGLVLPGLGGAVISQGKGGDGRRDGVRIRVDGPSWLVLGESYDKGWRARCNGRDLGPPVPIEGYANGWLVRPGCTSPDFRFAPNGTLKFAYLLSILGLPFLLVAAARRRRPRLASLAPMPDPDPARPLGLGVALAAGVAIALAIAFVFALRAGAVALPIAVLLLWRGVGVRRLIQAAAVLLIVGVPVVYLLSKWDNRGGYNTYYAVDHRFGHWVA